jgi:hypothetical protein
VPALLVPGHSETGSLRIVLGVKRSLMCMEARGASHLVDILTQDTASIETVNANLSSSVHRYIGTANTRLSAKSGE